MLPLLAAAIPGIIGGAYKAIAGAKQVKDGKKLAASLIDPIYARPNEITQSQNLAERNYLNGMPGSTAGLDTIGAASVNAFGNATQGASSSADVLDAATKINNNENNALNSLATQQSVDKLQAQQAYQNALNTSSGYADKEFQYNQDRPFQTKSAAASALIGSGNQNLFGGLEDVAGVGTSMLLNGIPGGKVPAMGAGVADMAPANLPGITNTMGGGLPQDLPSAAIPSPNMMGQYIFDPITKKYRQSFPK